MSTPNPNDSAQQQDKTPLDDLLDQDKAAEESETPDKKVDDTAAAPPDDQGDKSADSKTPEQKEGDDLEALKKEMRELRGFLRDQRTRNKALEDDLAAARKELEESGHLTKRSDEEIEALRAKQESRRDELETYLENMRLSNKYGDVDAVVTQARADDMIEIMARDYAAKNKTPLADAITEVQNFVWFQTKNSYRFLYDAIKKAHPDFVKKDDADGKKAPPSLANVPGGDGGKGGGVKDGQWTAEQIDNLPEDQLDKVPAEIYAKYMRGELK